MCQGISFGGDNKMFLALHSGECVKTHPIIHSRNVMVGSCLSKAVTKNKSHPLDIRVCASWLLKDHREYK